MNGTTPEIPPGRLDLSFRPAFLLMSGRALGFAVTFFIPVILVRVFDPAEFGTYKQFFLIYAMLYGVTQLGMAESLFYFLPSATRHPARYVANAVLVLAAAGLACLPLLDTSAPRISEWLNNRDLSEHMVLIGIYLVLMVTSAVLEIVMIARKRYGWASVSYASAEMLRALLLVLPALLFRSLEALLIGAVAFAGLRCGAALLYLRREFGGDLRMDPSVLKDQLAYALPFEMAVILETIQASLPQVAVSHYFDAATFAIYSVGCLQIPLVDFVASPAANVMMVRMSERLRGREGGAVLEIWHDTVRKLALLFAPLVGLLLVVSRELIVFLFTPAYAASVPIFMIWTVTMLLAAFQVDGVMRVYAQTRYLMAINAIRLLVIGGLIPWSLPRYGLLGAVGVTVLGLALAKGLALARMRRLMGVGWAALLPWRALSLILGAAGAAALPALAIRAALEGTTLPLLLIASLIFAATYVLLLLSLGLWTEGEGFAIPERLRRLLPGTAPPEGSGG